MFLNQYCTILDADNFSFSREQSSSFAKSVADDFNPLHDVTTKRFCVPGDLLFAKILTTKGLFSQMKITFNGMVSNDVGLHIAEQSEQSMNISDAKGKEYLAAEHHGEVTFDQDLIEQLVRSYVSFSGKNFPHVLIPLMKEKNVMINPSRPLVIYENMSIDLDTLDLVKPELEAAGAELTVNGKRGNVSLHFVFKDQGKVVGRGCKAMVMANLREYDQVVIDELVASYNDAKKAYFG